MKKVYSFICALAVSVVFWGLTSCNSNTSSQTDNLTDSSDVLDDQTVRRATQNIISVQSPIETTMLFKLAGVTYDQTLLNPASKVSSYNINKYKAFNLGVYTADLSYISLFEQAQTMISYVDASKKLADDLGILDAIDQETTKQLEENMHDRDMLMNIISETLMNSDSYLKENDRAEIAALVVTGGWIESLYLATRLTNKSMDKNKKLTDIILDHRIHITDLISLLETFEKEKDVAEVLAMVKDLQLEFNKIEVSQSNAGNNMLAAKIETKLTPETFSAICTKVENIRNKYTNI